MQEFDKMIVAQAGRCVICQEPLKKANIDHDHKTGRVRGLLCTPCNHAVGRLGDDPWRALRAAVYLSGWLG